MTNPVIALLQMTSVADLDTNLAHVETSVKDAAQSGADIIVLPEMFAQFGVQNQKPLAKSEAQFDGKVGRLLKGLARHEKIWIVAGTLPIMTTEDDRPRARCYVINDKGDVVAHYDKIHLFDAIVGDKQKEYRESDSYSPGSETVVFDSPWGRIGLAVCYDLRFPEIFRKLNDDGAQVVILPSAFTYRTGEAHWQVLCRARAIENGYFMVAVNQCGQHDERRQTWGHSMAISPWGDVEAMQHEVGIKLVTLDLDRVEAVRKQIPVNDNRRL